MAMAGQAGETDREKALAGLVSEMLDEEEATKESAMDAVDVDTLDPWELEVARESAYDAVGRD
jgi:hypothetical protein